MSKIETAIFSPVTLTATQIERLEELAKAVEQLIENEADKSEIRTAYDAFIEACFDLRQYENAIEGLNYLKANSSELDLSDAETADLYRKFGLVAFSKNEMEEAKTLFEKALNLVADEVDVVLEAKLLCDLGNLAAANEAFEEAAELYDAAIEFAEEHEIATATPFINAGLVYLQMGSLGDAIEYFEIALEHYEDDEELEKQEMLHLQLGSLYHAQNNFKEALLNYHYASELQEEDSEVLGKTYVIMANILTAMAEHNKSIEYYEKALPIFMEHGDIELKSEHCFQLANLYGQYKEDYATSLEYYKKALEIAKTDTENEDWRDLMVAKLEDSIEIAKENLAATANKKNKKSGFFGKLFGK